MRKIEVNDNVGTHLPKEQKEILENLERVSEDAGKKNEILAFALVLYDEENPALRKIFSDKDFVEALDKISGSRICVLVLQDDVRSRGIPRPIKSVLKGSKKIIEFLGGSSLPFHDRYSRILREIGEGSTFIKYPSILFFYFYQKKAVDSYMIELNETADVSSAYDELREVLQRLSQTLSRVTVENFGNKPEIFGLLRNELKHIANVRRLSTVWGIGKKLWPLVLPFVRLILMGG